MHTRENVDVLLLVLAHQDDEYFALPWLCDALQRGKRIVVLYLTDGGSRTDPQVRDAESRAALTPLGIHDQDFAFIGTKHAIPDGRLAHHLDAALTWSLEWLRESKITPTEVLSPDWEGGHQDHDAAHVVGLALAQHYGVSGWGFSLYNAFRAPRKLFRVLQPLPRSRQRTVAYGLTRAVHYAFFCWRYGSQRRTWLGLFPEAFFKRLLLRRENANEYNRRLVSERPHDGVLLYERMFGASYNDIAELTNSFLNRTLALTEAGQPRSAATNE